MLFDEKDLRVFENSDSRKYFQEILQSYYSQNYRATVVMLYSFVIYDLLTKLQTMANEGDKKAHKKITEIENMISNDDKYSQVENCVVEFFITNCSLYFNRFVNDIKYLKNCRNKCAHLQINNDSLYVPNDYHARMLICSMYDNVLSVKAPFIMDLFRIAEADVERYSAGVVGFFFYDAIDEAILKTITNKYLTRMTESSLLVSYKTFIKLLFVSNDDKCKENIVGLWIFTYALTDYIVKKGYVGIFREEVVRAVFASISLDEIKEDSNRRNALISLMVRFQVIMDIVSENEEMLEYLRESVFSKAEGLKYYLSFYPREEKNVYSYFKENTKMHKPADTNLLLNILKNSDGFDIAEFMKIMVQAIPDNNAFDIADAYTKVLINNLQDIGKEGVQEIMQIYETNWQCTGRRRDSDDREVINKFLSEEALN